MATDVIMPKVDMDQETGTVLHWLKKEGDTVRQGETLLEIETDKVAIEVEAPASGILADVLVGEGETVPIATKIATILAPGEDRATGGAAGEAAQAPPAPDYPPASGDGLSATPLARKVAQEAGLDLAAISGSGRGGKVTRKDVQALLEPQAERERIAAKVYATPAARRLAREAGIDPASLVGSGPGGRLQADDVAAAAARKLPPATPPEAGTEDETSAPYEVVPLSGKRRTIADRLTASYQNAPHITFTSRVDMSGFADARARLNGRVEPQGLRISTTALLVKIVARTLAHHPWLNSALVEDEIRLYRDVHMGVAVALEDGLIVPVIRHADGKGVAQINAELDDLAARAREGTLSLSEVRDGTFTISNLGPFGVESFTAIINPPQSAILAVGATVPAAVAAVDGEIEVRPVMRITLSADHRVVDGAVAARFLADLKAALESPVLLIL